MARRAPPNWQGPKFWALGIAAVIALGLAGGLAQAASEPRTPQDKAKPATGSSPSGPEADLKAIRAALVEAATKARTRVRSLSWIDSQGRLHESTQFDSDVAIRGIRVNGYLPPKPGEAVPIDRPEVCQSGHRLKRHAVYELRPPLLGAFFTEAMLANLSQEFGQDLLSLFAAESGWAITQAQVRPSERYGQALLHRQQDEAPYRLTVQVSDRGPMPVSLPQHPADRWLGESLTAIGLQKPAKAEGLLGLTVRLEETRTGRLVWAEQIDIRLRQPSAGYLDAPTAVLADPQDVKNKLAALRTGLRDSFQCEPPVYPVVENRSTGLIEIQGGKRVGLAAGQRLLLAPQGKLPRHILEEGVVEQIALAEVQSVTQDRAVLRLLAGPAPQASAAAELVALPF